MEIRLKQSIEILETTPMSYSMILISALQRLHVSGAIPLNQSDKIGIAME